MTLLDVRFSDWIQQGFRLFTDNALLLMLCGLVALAISGVTLGLLAGPMLAGMAVIIVNLMDERLAKPTINDLFKGFDYFVETIPVTLALYALGLASWVMQLIPLLGQIVTSVVVSVGWSLAILSVYHLIVRKIPPRQSAAGWFELFKANWGPLLGFFILIAIIGFGGVLFFIVGLAVTIPVQLCILGRAYAAIQSQSAAL